MKSVIIDDEAGSRNNLKFLLERFCPQVEVAGWAADAEEGLSLINAEEPDLVFLDIEMPEQDGFQLIEKLPSYNRPKIIFTTAYEQYAVKAFKVSAVDYLLKPIDIDELKATVQRIEKEMNIIVEDNGKGFDTSDESSGKGLKNIREDVEELGGQFQIDSVKGRGTSIVINIPNICP